MNVRHILEQALGLSASRRRSLRVAAATLAAGFLLAACGGGDGPSWKATWAKSQLDPTETRPGETTPAVISFNNQTVRQIFRVSIGGEQVRFRISNLFGSDPLRVDAARVARSKGAGAVDTASDTAITFGGSASITIPVGTEIWSDAVALAVKPLEELAVSMYFANPTPIRTQHSLGRQENYVVAGNQVSASALANTDLRQIYYFLSGVDVATSARTNVVVTFGDSITDGFNASVNLNRRWPDVLAQRLLADPSNGNVAVVNAGISGNRVITNVRGPKGVDRFERDVLNQTGVTHVTILLGINDIGRSVTDNTGPVDNVITGVQSMIDKAKARGLKVYLATLTPFKGVAAPYYTPENEAKRATYNAWVRANKTVDGVIDFDATTRDPADPAIFLAAYDSGDHLHPNDAGYLAMANSLNLSLFKVAP